MRIGNRKCSLKIGMNRERVEERWTVEGEQMEGEKQISQGRWRKDPYRPGGNLVRIGGNGWEIRRKV